MGEFKIDPEILHQPKKLNLHEENYRRFYFHELFFFFVLLCRTDESIY